MNFSEKCTFSRFRYKALVSFFFLICCYHQVFMIDNITITGYDSVRIALKIFSNDTCGEILYIKNDNLLSVDVQISNGTVSLLGHVEPQQTKNFSVGGLSLEKNDYVIVNISMNVTEVALVPYLVNVSEFNTSNLINSSSLDKNVSVENFSTVHMNKTAFLIKNMSIILRPAPDNLTVSNSQAYIVNTTCNIQAAVVSEFVTFFRFKPMYMNQSDEWVPLDYNITSRNMTSATISLFLNTPGNYSLQVMVISVCGDELNTTVNFTVLTPIENSVEDLTYQASTPRGASSVYYPKDIVGIALKVKNSNSYSTAKPTQTYCTADWGDNSGIIMSYDADLTPDSQTLHIFEAQHRYSQVGSYKAKLVCQNAVSKETGQFSFHIISPVLHSWAEVLMEPVPYNVSGYAVGYMQIFHSYLNDIYTDLLITIDFGARSVPTSLTYTSNSSIVSYTYNKRGKFSINVTFESFNVTSVQLFDIRVGALVDFYQIKHRSMIRINEPTIFRLIRYLWNSSLDVTLMMNPGILKKSFQLTNNLLEFNITYVNESFNTATARIQLYNITEEIYYNFETYQPCISTVDLFESSYTNLTSPLKVWLSVLPKISGRAERTMACNESDKFNMSWQVWKNIGNSSWEKQNITQPKAIVLDFIFITSLGLYQIELNISVIGKREKESDVMYLEVVPPPLVALISRGQFRQVMKDSDLTLDASSVSYDPPLSPDKSNLSFSWSCFYLLNKDDITRYALPYYHNDTSYRQLAKCNITNWATMATKGIMAFSTTSIKENNLILFEVNVTKDNRYEIATQTVELVSSQSSDIFINCLWNCERKLSTDDRTVYTVKCKNCSSRAIYEAQYRWSIYKYNPLTFSNIQILESDWSMYISSDQNSSKFDTKGLWWEEANTYTIAVDVNITGYAETRTIMVVYTNMKPYNGSCDVIPTQGIALETVFVFHFNGWKDEGIRDKRSSLDSDMNLQYEVYQFTSAGNQLVYYGVEKQASTVLSECSVNATSCQVIVNIIDKYKAKVSCFLQIMITPKYQPSVSNGDDSMDNNFVDMMKKMNSSISVKDSLKIAKRAATLTSSLSSLKKMNSSITVKDSLKIANETTVTTVATLQSSNSQKDFSQAANNFVDIVGDIIHSYNPRSSAEVQVLANSMSVLTNDSKLMNTNSIVTASNAISKLADKYQNLDGNLPDLIKCLDEITDVIHNIVEYQAMDMDEFYSELSRRADELGLFDLEKQFYIDRETKQKQLENLLKQHQIDDIVSNLTSSWNGLFSVIPKMNDPTGNYNKSKQSFVIATQNTTVSELMNQTNNGNPLGFTFDNIGGTDSLSPLVIKAVKTKNIYIQGLNSGSINADIIIGSVSEDNGNLLSISSPKIIHETKESNCSFKEDLAVVFPQFIEGDASSMFYHQLDYAKTNLHICLKIRPTNPMVSYTLFMRMGLEPTDILFDIRKQLTSDMLKPCQEICFPPGTFTRTGTIYLGLKPSANDTAVISNSKIQKRSVLSNLQDSYFFGVTTSACFSWDNLVKDWVADKCKLTKENGNVVCQCEDDKQVISGISFNFLPNKIHFGTVFSKFDINAQGLVFGVLGGLYVLFAALSFWAYYMDKKATTQCGVFPLADNYSEDDCFYLITVHTGLKRSAGTKSNVYFCLYGSNGDSGVRKLSDGIKNGFPTGSICHFVMACQEHLGDLQCLRIWHDNSGKGNEATWYLDKIDVADLQKGLFHYFICEEWLAVENTIDTTIEASGAENMESLKNLFISNIKQHLTDDHIWLSIFIRPYQNRFSCVERTLCCLAFLCLAMITSAMFYTGLPDPNRQQPKVDFEIGPLRIGYQELYNSFLSGLITTAPMMLIILMLKKSRNYRDPRMCACSNKVKNYKTSLDQEFEDQSKKKKYSICALPWMAKLEKELETLEKVLLTRPSAVDLNGTWPHIFRYFAWILMALSIGVSSFFVILFSMEWGKDVTESWLTSFFLAFLQSLFVLDPVKVIVLSVFLALLVKKVKPKSLDELDLSLISQINKKYGLKQRLDHSIGNHSAPLSKSSLKAATLRRKIHIMIKNTFKEFLIHFVYLLIISSLCYSNLNGNAYRMSKVINDQLVTDICNGFMQINSTKEYFNWTSRVFVPWLLPDLSSKMKQSGSNLDKALYTDVEGMYRMGAARLRQLRIQKENCSLQNKQIKDCVPSYSSGTEETKDYCLHWGLMPCSPIEVLNSMSSAAWSYKSSQDLWGLPIAGTYSVYGGGGYIAPISINMQVAQNILMELKQNNWIDQKTRAIFLEFTVYCPSINHFTFVILLAEINEIGGVIPFVNVYPFTVHNPPGLQGTFLQLCQIVAIILTLLGILYIIFIFSQKKWSAFKNLWFVLDLSAVVLAVCTVSMFMLQLSYTKAALNKIKENRNAYINFYHVVIWNSSYTLCLALLLAIGYLRLLKIASFSEKTMKIYAVLSKAIHILPGFFFFVILILLGFIGMGYALFGKTSYYFKDLLTTAESLFTGLLGRSSFRDTNVPQSDRWTTILYFCLFVGTIVIFLTNYFIAVLMDILTAHGNRYLNEESTKIFIVLWDSFLKLFGKNTDPTERIKDLVKEDEDETETSYIDEKLKILEEKMYWYLNVIEKEN